MKVSRRELLRRSSERLVSVRVRYAARGGHRMVCRALYNAAAHVFVAVFAHRGRCYRLSRREVSKAFTHLGVADAILAQRKRRPRWLELALLTVREDLRSFMEARK